MYLSIRLATKRHAFGISLGFIKDKKFYFQKWSLGEEKGFNLAIVGMNITGTDKFYPNV